MPETALQSGNRKTVKGRIPLRYQGVHSAEQNPRRAAIFIFYGNVVRTEFWWKYARGGTRYLQGENRCSKG
jgi:hypothetical protein